MVGHGAGIAVVATHAHRDVLRRATGTRVAPIARARVAIVAVDCATRLARAVVVTLVVARASIPVVTVCVDCAVRPLVRSGTFTALARKTCSPLVVVVANIADQAAVVGECVQALSSGRVAAIRRARKGVVARLCSAWNTRCGCVARVTHRAGVAIAAWRIFAEVRPLRGARAWIADLATVIRIYDAVGYAVSTNIAVAGGSHMRAHVRVLVARVDVAEVCV